MRRLEEISWGQPALPLPDDPEWAREVEAAMGDPRAVYLYAGPSRWLRQGLLRGAQVRYRHLSDELLGLVILVTSQENACRYCYGSARALLRLMGLSPTRIDAVERGIKLADANPLERAILDFSRNLSKSNPRPVRADADAIVAMGSSPEAITDIAFAVVTSCLANRFSTFVAVPLFPPVEEAAAGRMDRLKGFVKKMMAGGYPKPLPPAEPPRMDGPFGALVKMIEGMEGAVVIDELLRGAFSSSVIKRRTAAWMFAVVSTALDCRLCGGASRAVLVEEGVPPEKIDRVLQNLSGPELDETEAILLPWVRETVHYQTEVMQRKTHELGRKVPSVVLLEAIGITALANACARLSMLEQ